MRLGSCDEQVPAKYVPHFKAGKELRERVDFNRQEESAPTAPGPTVVAPSSVSPSSAS